MPVIALVPELPWSMLAKELAFPSGLACELPPSPFGVAILQVQLFSSCCHVQALQIIETDRFLIVRMA